MRANKNISNSKKLRAKSSINRNLFKKDEKKKNSIDIILEHEEVINRINLIIKKK